MGTKQYIDGLFSGYEETLDLVDFKEELQSNLDDKINNLIRKGLTQEMAFEKATTELGDISILAEEISFKKQKEVLSEMYMKTRNYMNTGRIALYVLFGAILGFGIIVTLLTSFRTSEPAAPMGTLLVFGGCPLLGLLFLGLTQETASHVGMSWKRALWYVAAGSVFVFGVFVFSITYFYAARGIADSIATLIPFVLPSITLGAFLILTEKDRRKPWVKKLADEQISREMERFSGPVQAERFGLISGAIWITGIAVFIILTIQIGILYSWLAFVGALVIQMIFMASSMGGKK